MKLSKLNLGQSLSRDEQKNIKGGQGSCNLGQGIYCTCVNKPTSCAFATYNNEDMNSICYNYCGGPYTSRGSGCGQCGGNP